MDFVFRYLLFDLDFEFELYVLTFILLLGEPRQRLASGYLLL